MWYSNLYRRHLCDMHIEDDKDVYLARFSPDEYIKNLKNCKANYAMLYYQSHVGLCYYPTESGVMHKAFEGNEDAMRRLESLCHENGIKVIGYYSLIFNTREHDRHPKWRMLTDNGQSRRERGGMQTDGPAFASKQMSRYGLCCPNNAEYTDFVKTQIDEILEYFNPDALFFDMPFWPWPSTCHCDSCKARWAREEGGEIPAKAAPGSPDNIKLVQKRYTWMGEWVQTITDYIKSKRPDMPVEYNLANLVAGSSNNGCGESVNAASDYCGGDLYGDTYSQSFICKLYKNITQNPPFEYMFSRCKPALRSHTLTKSLDEMKTAIAVTAAHHGATLVIDAIDPAGTMDGRVYDRVGKAFELQIPYEPYFRGEMVEDVAIYYGIKSKLDLVGTKVNSIDGCTGISRTLIKNHIPFGVTGNFHRLEGYRSIIAPLLLETEKADNARLCEYVKNGGVLYLSGVSNRELAEELTGGKIGARIDEKRVYIAPKSEYEGDFADFNAQYPLPYDGVAFEFSAHENCQVLATYTLPYTNSGGLAFASIHSDPPGVATDIPAVVARKYGKGTVIWSALPLECGETEEYGDILLSLLKRFGGVGAPSFGSAAPANVELTMFEDGGERLVSCIVHSQDTASYPVAPFAVKVRCETAPSSVTLLPDNTPVAFEYSDGYVTFMSRTLNIFDMYRIS